MRSGSRAAAHRRRDARYAAPGLFKALRECELLVFHARSLPDAEKRANIERPLLVTSQSEAHVGLLLPNCPAAPRLPGPFCDLNDQEDRRRCLPANNAKP